MKKNIICYDINKKLKFNNNNFDLVLSINTLHNLKLENLNQALKEIERVGKKKFICVESFRNEKEFFNLQCWALTAETLIDTKSWKWLFMNSGYTGILSLFTLSKIYPNCSNHFLVALVILFLSHNGAFFQKLIFFNNSFTPFSKVTFGLQSNIFFALLIFA